MFFLQAGRSNWRCLTPVGFTLNMLFVCLFTLYGLYPRVVNNLRLSLRFVPANHRQLSLPFSAWKSLEKDVVYKAASGKAINRLAFDWSWSHLDIGPALWLEVGPLWKTREILPGGSPSVKLLYLLNQLCHFDALQDSESKKNKGLFYF